MVKEHRSRVKAEFSPSRVLAEFSSLSVGSRRLTCQRDQFGDGHDAPGVFLALPVWDRPGEQVLEERLAGQPSHSRLLEILSGPKDNLEALRRALAVWVLAHQRAAKDQAPMRGTLDIDGFPISVHGRQAGGAYNGYYQGTIYNSLAASFSAGGDYDGRRLGEGFVHAILRKGNAAPAAGAVRFILAAMKKCQGLARSLDVRFDASFTVGPVMDPLTDRGVRFVGRLRNNAALSEKARRSRGESEHAFGEGEDFPRDGPLVYSRQ